MTRFTLFALLGFAAASTAQDMPLDTILLEGEGWKASDEKRPELDASRKDAKTGTYADPRGSGLTSAAVAKTGAAIKEPAGVVTARDGGTLVVGDAGGRYLWSFRVGKDGGLDAGDKNFFLRVPRVAPPTDAGGKPKFAERSDVSALAIDAAGRVYAATPLGVQVFDPTARMCGVIAHPDKGPITAMLLVEDRLVVEVGDKVYVRKLKARALPPAKK